MKQTGFRNLGFAWGVRSGPKGTVIDLPIFGFEGHNPYPVRANTMKQIGFRNLGFALGVCSGLKGPVIDQTANAAGMGTARRPGVSGGVRRARGYAGASGKRAAEASGDVQIVHLETALSINPCPLETACKNGLPPAILLGGVGGLPPPILPARQQFPRV